MADNNQDMLERLNNTIEKVLDKLDAQNQKVSEISVKVDLYRETQQDQNRKIETLEQKVTEVTESAKSAHKRTDDLGNANLELKKQLDKMNEEKVSDNKWMRRLILGGVLTIVTGVVTAILIAHWGVYSSNEPPHTTTTSTTSTTVK